MGICILKTALVTGGAGFIGSNLVNALEVEGYEVKIFDNFETGKKLFLKNFSGEILIGDLRTDISLLKKACKGVDVIFHLAANADVRYGWDHPRLDLDQNVVATLNVLDAAVASNVSEFVFSSTGSVYGEATQIPTPEDYGLPIQTSLYGASKYSAEGYIAAYATAEKIKATIFRFVSVLGPRYTHGHVIDFVRQLQKDPTNLQILGDGTQRKSYMHITDCVSGVINVRSMKQLDIFNLGTDATCQVNDSVSWICKTLGIQPKLNYSGGSRGWVGDNPHIHLDSSKAIQHGWKVEKNIEDSVIDTVQWLIANPEICKENE